MRCCCLALVLLVLCLPLGAADLDRLQVGLQPDGSVVVPTNQLLRPAGKQVTFHGRPVDLALADGGRTLVIKNLFDLVFLDTATGQIRQSLYLAADGQPPAPVNLAELLIKKAIGDDGKPPHADIHGFSVVGLLVHEDRVYVTDARNHVRVAERRPDGRYAWGSPLALAPPQVGGLAFPTGLALQGKDMLWVCSSRGNSVQRIHRTTGRVEEVVPVGVAPYMIVCPRADRCYVSNWGGDPPVAGAPQALSSGTPVRINPETGVANEGSVSVLGLVGGRWQQLRTIRVGLLPSGLLAGPKGHRLYVANANSDTVSVIDLATDTVVETIPCRPESRLPFGSGANALALSPDGGTLYVANATNNCLAVVTLGAKAREAPSATAPPRSLLAGLIPTAWYPGAVLLSPDGRRLYVANVKGVGALSQPRPVAQGHNTHDFLGSVSLIDVPAASELPAHTRTVNANNRLAFSLAGLEKPRPGIRPVPVPERHGEPSVFEHVLYVIKENRSYDQIFGDIKEGNGDPALVMFGEDVTPNQHALARQFTLFDNFYCSSTLSATGHQWTNEAYVTDYLTRAFGGFTRSYPVDGDDALAFASSGFLWDNALRHRKTFRNYGEFTTTTYQPANATWTDIYNDYKNGTRKVTITVRPNVRTLEPYTHPHYPGFPLVTPDVYRAQLFLKDLEKFEQEGKFPNLVYLFLPADHSVGTHPGFPTPRAMLADNDLALGRVVEAVSRSRFWPRTCIFVIEDDPQFGMDHVDGHRSLCQVISPYTRRRFVDHTNYNQTGIVKTIELILGLPPMNQLDLSATPLRSCFQEAPDLTPFTAVPNRVPLDEMNPPLEQLRGQALHWAKKSMELAFDKEDKADEDTFNRILWFATRGEEPYPERKVGPGKRQ